VPHVKNGMKAPRFSSFELRVQAIASREANNQLLRVTWDRFRMAYEEYPRWQALALWVEAVIGTERRPPSSLLATLKSIVPVSSRGARHHKALRCRQVVINKGRLAVALGHRQ
jgi:hypothetical protein